MLQGQRVLAFGLLLLTLVFVESLVRNLHLTELHGDDKVGVVRLVDADGRVGEVSQAVVDDLVLYLVLLRSAHIYGRHVPPVLLQLFNHGHIESLV